MAIFNTAGVPIREVLLTAALGLRPPHHRLPPPRPILVRGQKGEGLRRYFKDKLGDIIHVWRAHPLTSRNLRSWDGEKLRKTRALHGVGRPHVAMQIIHQIFGGNPFEGGGTQRWSMPARQQGKSYAGKLVENMIQARGVEHIEAAGLDRAWIDEEGSIAEADFAEIEQRVVARGLAEIYTAALPSDSFTHGPAIDRGPMGIALAEHGSQRAAARALGMNLSTFQRRLAKEAV